MNLPTPSQLTTAVPTKQKSGVFSFCTLAFVISWLWWGFRFYPYLGSWIAGHRYIARSDLGTWDVQIGMLGPLLAALIVRLWITREGLRGSFALRRPWKDYLLAILLPAAVVLGAIVINHISGLAPFTWAGERPGPYIASLGMVILLASLTALGEEYGWRGFLLPHLLHHGGVKATIITGAAWGLWHLPLLVTGLTFPGEPVLIATPVFLFAAIMLSSLFTWLYQLSAGGILVVALLHGTVNAMTEVTSLEHFPGSPQWLVSPFGLTTAVIILLICLVYSFTRWLLMTGNQGTGFSFRKEP